MDEFKILSEDDNSKKIEELSVNELEIYKLELISFIKKIDEEIKHRQIKKAHAENFFKRTDS